MDSFLLITVCLVLLVLIFLLTHGILHSSSSPVIRLNIKGGKALISAPFYSYTFELDAMDSLQIFDSIPFGVRTNGLDIGFLRAGHFALEGIGPCRVYAYKANDPVLFIRLNGKRESLLLGGRTPEETEQRHQELLPSA
jgi:hypothetical protein